MSKLPWPIQQRNGCKTGQAAAKFMETASIYYGHVLKPSFLNKYVLIQKKTSKNMAKQNDFEHNKLKFLFILVSYKVEWMNDSEKINYKWKF